MKEYEKRRRQVNARSSRVENVNNNAMAGKEGSRDDEHCDKRKNGSNN